MDCSPASAPARRRSVAQSFLDAFTWRSIVIALVSAVLAALSLKPIFHIPFVVLLGRTLAVSALLLLAFAAGRTWQLPGVPRWLAPVVAVALTAPVATLLAYLPSIDGRLGAMLEHEGRITGFILITGVALVIAPLLALGALYRERDTQARAEQLAFQLERSTLEKQALDARLKLLNAQIEPHFLFNTLANVQELVESGSPRAAPVLRSLIAYLRAAMPKLHAGQATLADEAGLVRAYLELMHMRMPDRLDYSVDVPESLGRIGFPAMGLLTLVENAVHHGIDPSEAGGRISVVASAASGDEGIRIVVADTGAGLSDQAVSGTGLENLRARLRAFFGSAARLELHENTPHGLRAEITVPHGLPASA
ncbi:MAG TPA: histidine kinase [Caldimonas sp.]|jgi:signal transduction histidine kinase|nr:histidine kinase [Caldimonas sp.]HEX2541878.1 histidine kinase [Caldimonas sp.]